MPIGEFTFTATAATHELRLIETRDNSANGNDLGIDDISITHVCRTAATPVMAVPALEHGGLLGLLEKVLAAAAGLAGRRRARKG